jgi:hypothetical protein
VSQKKQNSEQNFWQGLDIQSLQTPYSEILEMIQVIDPKDGDTWVDLGAGYGRMGISLGFLKPNVNFLGFEYVSERVQEGQRNFKLWNIKNAELKMADIAADDFVLPEAEVYFIYDFGSQKDVYKVLEKLRRQAAKKEIKLIARGRGMRNWIFMDFPWLSIKTPQHFTNWSIFTS